MYGLKSVNSRMDKPPQVEVVREHYNVINQPGFVVLSKQVLQGQIHGEIPKERDVF